MSSNFLIYVKSMFEVEYCMNLCVGPLLKEFDTSWAVIQDRVEYLHKLIFGDLKVVAMCILKE